MVSSRHLMIGGLVALATFGCSESTSGTSPDVGLTPLDTGSPADASADGLGADGATQTDDTTPGDGKDDVAVPADTAADADTSTPLCPGGFGCGCTTNDECVGGYCVTGSGGGRVCSEVCVESCPDGWKCVDYAGSSEVIFLCVPDVDRLCAACSSDLDCGDGSRCLLDGSGAGRCGRSCSDVAPCPSGFTCDLVGSEADAITQCVPVGGECPCSELLSGATRSCSTDNAFGSCTGSSICGAAGWSVCDAAVPAAELCNDVDDNCDGDIDEPFMGLGQPCDSDDVDTCANGVIACAADHQGVECSEDTPAVEQCDGTDNDCDGLVDEDYLDSDADTLADCVDDDDDDDGISDAVDCAPVNPAVSQNAVELCDGVDQNCDGAPDDGFSDLDGDGAADCVDQDIDGDQFPNVVDNCPLVANKDQKDLDDDGTGDACEDDADGDGVLDATDNCKKVPNPAQSDTDGDGAGDTCDLDDDGDGSGDGVDCQPLSAAAYPGAPEVCDAVDNNCNGVIDEGYADFDNDKLTNCVDTDDDNDGAPDALDCEPLNPMVFPGALELCNGADDDCSGLVDDFAPDTDEDGLADCVDQDDDGDDVPDVSDNCPLVPNPDQASSDADGKGDACDLDDDNDGSPDAVDCAPTTATVHPGAIEICNGIDDNCSGKKDEGFDDSEGDGIADCVDPDDDNDGIVDAFDNCPTFKNSDQKNSDNDLLGDACDLDDDNDSVPDIVDCEPLDKTVNLFETEKCNGKDDNCDFVIDEGFPDTNGDGKADCGGADADVDGIPDTVDNCLGLANPSQQNTDGDALGDACDSDDDGDGSPDAVDCAPLNAAVSPLAKELCDGKDENCDGAADDGFPDADGDGAADCVDADDDNDGVADVFDSCPFTPNEDQKNSDNDLIGNACDKDDDNDGSPDTSDCAPLNPAISEFAAEVCDGVDNNCDGQTDETFADTDGDGTANCVDEDDDGDGVLDTLDNCPSLQNPSQANSDSDLLGNACDADDDNDGSADLDDCAPTNPAVSPTATENCDGFDNDCDGLVDELYPDVDQDGEANCVDADDDGDGVPDGQDNCPLVANSGQQNSDTDAVGDACDTDDDNDDDPDLTDCAPKDATISHSAVERCDGIDNDCSGTPDQNFSDTDNDGAADCVDVDDDDDGSPDQLDCAPLNKAVYPGAKELCGNGVDDDCDPKTVCVSGTYGTTSFTSQPFPGAKGAVSFFQYGAPDGSSSNTGLERANTLIPFLYQDPTNGQYELVILIDKVNDGTAGTLTMAISGAPGAGLMLVDDPGEIPSTAISASGAGTLTWAWASCCTDGAIIGPIAPGSCVTMTVLASTGLSEVGTYDGGTYKPLGPTTAPLTLCASP